MWSLVNWLKAVSQRIRKESKDLDPLFEFIKIDQGLKYFNAYTTTIQKEYPYYDELKGLNDGTEEALNKILVLNFENELKAAHDLSKNKAVVAVRLFVSIVSIMMNIYCTLHTMKMNPMRIGMQVLFFKQILNQVFTESMEVTNNEQVQMNEILHLHTLDKLLVCRKHFDEIFLIDKTIIFILNR